MKEEVFARLLLQLASLIINGGLTVLAERWNRGVLVLRQAQQTGTPIPDSEVKALTDSIGIIGDELLRIATVTREPSPA